MEDFLSKENANKSDKMSHFTFMKKLDNDIEFLKRFKATLGETEQQYLSRLMVHLRYEMKRKEVATAGRGAM